MEGHHADDLSAFNSAARTTESNAALIIIIIIRRLITRVMSEYMTESDISDVQRLVEFLM